MSTRKERKEFQPRIIGEASFCGNGNNPGPNDLHFRIIQVTINGGCVVEMLTAEGEWQKQNHTRSPAKAWDSIRYQAGITFYTERSLGAPETDPLIKPKLGQKGRDISHRVEPDQTTDLPAIRA